MVKGERLYIRTTKEKKEFLQDYSAKITGGNINALFDVIIDDLMEEASKEEEEE